MPTINQLVRKGRKPLKAKTKSPALLRRVNLIKNKTLHIATGAPFMRGVEYAPRQRQPHRYGWRLGSGHEQPRQ
jgi:ribosomal protein S12